MAKQTSTRFGIIVLLTVMLVVGLKSTTGLSAVNDSSSRLTRSSWSEARRRATRSALPISRASLEADGRLVTQTFNLSPGWNTIYLEVEPINPSPLVGVGFLFSTGWSFQQESDLDAGSLPDTLRQAFGNNGISLTDSVSVARLEDTYWMISDNDKMVSYAVFHEVNGGNVFNVYNAALHEQSTIEAVFATLACDACLESVWTWNVPQSTMDYIVDPGEGLWDEPGWKRYFPETSIGSDGASREFLTDLLNLHANTGYLVKLRDDADAVTLTVTGQPLPRNHHWLKGSYNLAGFPIEPDAPPTVVTFFQNLEGGPSPITEVRALGSDGRWGAPLASGDTLNPGQAYLVYYDDQDPDAVDDYTAPLNILDYIGDGLAFLPGYAGRRQTVRVENLSSSEATIFISLIDGATAEVAVRYEDSSTDPDTSVELKVESVEITLPAGDAKDLEFAVLSTEQLGDGEGLLELSSNDLGTRWLIPIEAEAGSVAGLWIGDVYVNDVSQAHLGDTNVEGGSLTIELRQRDESGIRGAAEFSEIISGNASSVAMTLTLPLPTADEVVIPQAIAGDVPYVGGYVYEDANQNGQRDGDEMGFEGVTVTLMASGAIVSEVTTGADGIYLFEGLDPDTYTLALLPQPPAGYTADFDVTPPVDEIDEEPPPPQANIWPVEVVVDEEGITQIIYNDGSNGEFPLYDAANNRVESLLNFGYVRTFDASLWTGVCADRLEKRRDLDPVLNGQLVMAMENASLNPPPGPVEDELLGAVQYLIYVEEAGGGGEEGKGIACGEIVVGAPTVFGNGQGSEFHFRLLLRVDENGLTELLPYYEVENGLRVSSAAFSIQEPEDAGGVDFGDTSGLLDFLFTIDAQDPLNPYKHKYHPDHDNLDVKFNEIDFDAVAPHLWEVPEIHRRIQLELTELPPLPDSDAAARESLAREVDWGGTTWGGLYKEVIKGIHKNDITTKGYFVIRHALSSEDLTLQAYDQVGGGGE